jgi:hypothetical protein
MSSDDLMEAITENGMKELGTASELVCNKIRDMAYMDKLPLDDMTLIISHLKREELRI